MKAEAGLLHLGLLFAATLSAQAPNLTGTWKLTGGTNAPSGFPVSATLYISENVLIGGGILSGQFLFDLGFGGGLIAPFTGSVQQLSGNYYQLNAIMDVQFYGGKVITFSAQGYPVGQSNAQDILRGTYNGFAGQWTATRTSASLPPTISIPTPVQPATSKCSTSSLNGPYSFSGNGFLVDASGSNFLASNIGRITADGAGNVSGSETFGMAGIVNKFIPLSGTYFVNPDCTGTVSLRATPVVAARSIDFVITSGGGWQFMYTNDGSAFTGTAYQVVAPIP